MIIRIDATLPHLVTKADVADLRTETRTELAGLHAELARMPSHGYLWMVMAAMTVAFSAALAGAGLLLTYLPHMRGPQ
jgi:hypothetical protein